TKGDISPKFRIEGVLLSNLGGPLPPTQEALSECFSRLGLLGPWPIMPGAISICGCLRAVHEGAAKTDHAAARRVYRTLYRSPRSPRSPRSCGIDAVRVGLNSCLGCGLRPGSLP